MSLVYANGLLLLMVLVELWFLSSHEKKKIPWREVIFNLNSGHILMWIFRGLEISGFYYVSTYIGFDLFASWSYWSIWIFTFIAWDFCFYWEHRLHHKYHFLWAVHVVHHEGEHFGLSLGIRNSWYSSITSFPFFVGLALMGTPVEIFIATSSIHYFIQFYNHNSIVKKSGWLEKIMITPSHHRVHHGSNDEYRDRNFGGTLVIWDKLFGTFQPEQDDIEIEFGVKNYEKNHNVVWANNRPFLKLFKFPIKDKAKQVANYIVSDGIVAVGGLLIFCLLLYFISIEHIWASQLKLGLFAVIFFGTIANGGLSEHKNWGVYLWIVNFLFLSPLFIIALPTIEPILVIILILLAIHSLWTLTSIKKVIASPLRK